MGERKRKQGTLGKAKDMHPHPRSQKGKKIHSGVNSRKTK